MRVTCGHTPFPTIISRDNVESRDHKSEDRCYLSCCKVSVDARVTSKLTMPSKLSYPKKSMVVEVSLSYSV